MGRAGAGRISERRTTFVHAADLVLDAGTAPQAPGTPVTLAFCGHWEHDGPCRWPHNTAFRTSGGSARIRTVMSTTPADEERVRDLIDRALRGTGGWTVISSGPDVLRSDEEALAERLRAGPHLAAPSSGSWRPGPPTLPHHIGTPAVR